MSSSRPTTTIRPRKSWLPPQPREIWTYRELALRFAARDITLRYRQTALGVSWVVIQPLLGAGVLAFVFGGVAGLASPDGIPYFLFSLAGMVGWTAFSQTATRSSASLLANAAMVQKVFFPRLLLPFSTVLSTMVDVIVSVGLLAVLLVTNRVWAGAAILTYPIWLLMMVLLGLGVGLMASSLMVRYRDIQYVLPVAVQLLLYASPVAYEVSAVPESVQWVFALNPLTGALEGIRWATLGTPPPSVALASYAGFASLAVFVAGMLVFSRNERRFADVI